MRYWNSFLYVAALICATAFYGNNAEARGFCNVSIGKSEQSPLAAMAAAQFYDGSAHLLKMLAAFEGPETGRARSEAEMAMKSLSESGRIYAEAEKPVGELKPTEALVPGRILGVVGEQNALAVHQVLKIANQGPIALVARCGAAARALALRVGEFAKNAAAHPAAANVIDLLNSFTNTLNFGTAASATFADWKLEKVRVK